VYSRRLEANHHGSSADKCMDACLQEIYSFPSSIGALQTLHYQSTRIDISASVCMGRRRSAAAGTLPRAPLPNRRNLQSDCIGTVRESSVVVHGPATVEWDRFTDPAFRPAALGGHRRLFFFLGWAVLTLRPDNTSPTGVGVISSFFFTQSSKKKKSPAAQAGMRVPYS
jgi:hypothetical protein